MITEAVIVAVIALVGNIAVSWFAHRKSTALMEYRMDKLEEKVSVHNHLIERMYKVEQDVALLQNDIEDIKGKE